MRDAGHRTAEKAKIIYPPPRGVDIMIKYLSWLVTNNPCIFAGHKEATRTRGSLAKKKKDNVFA